MKLLHFHITELENISWQWEENSWEFVRFAFDHQHRNEKAKNNSRSWTTIDVLIPGDPRKMIWRGKRSLKLKTIFIVRKQKLLGLVVKCYCSSLTSNSILYILAFVSCCEAYITEVRLLTSHWLTGEDYTFDLTWPKTVVKEMGKTSS